MILYKRLLSAVDSMDSMDNTNPWVELYKRAETIEYSGLVVTHLAADPGIVQLKYIIHNAIHYNTTIQYITTIHYTMAGMMEVTGRIISTADLARRYGLTDIDGSTPMDLRCEEWVICTQI